MNGNVYGQYACRIVGSILFHSVPYEQKDKASLEWWEYDKLGESASLGCVRLAVEDSKWIYDNCIPGTKVEFYTSATSGPLGKPTRKKITEDEEVRNWDPTDPDENNPWKEYLKKKQEEEQKRKVEENNKQNEVQDIVENSILNNTDTLKTNMLNSDIIQNSIVNNVSK